MQSLLNAEKKLSNNLKRDVLRKKAGILCVLGEFHLLINALVLINELLLDIQDIMVYLRSSNASNR